eukprot:TRINITY_DN1767_c0_g1_i2.p1 TRINITY_DN1767_c0_g1~~TRINITY_DN1767_c0_g1_i2.p1  ORF type:complete len:391 (+),score=82.17 TRINITY_DN1767_c0_g1_i2:36-1208(+)
MGEENEPQQRRSEDKENAEVAEPPIKEDDAKSSLAVSAEVLKYGSLACLVAQNSSLTLTMRASRIPGADPMPMYLATSAVVACEVVKLFLSAVMLTIEKEGVEGAWKAIQSDILSSFSQNLMILIPSGLYTLQNNLQYFAASHLDPPTYQVLSQMKLITTALLSTVILNKKLSVLQWTAIVLLGIGIALVQTSQGKGLMSSSEDGSLSDAAAEASGSRMFGFIAVFIACCTSGLAGVYLEKIVKQTKPSVWIRNMQLASWGLLVGLMASYFKDYDAIVEGGFFQGFKEIVWVVVALQSVGGILIAVVVKYSDNIVKGFATGLSIVSSATASVWLFSFIFTLQYVLGATIVIVSVYLYSVQPACLAQFFPSSTAPPPPPPPTIPEEEPQKE